MPTTMIKVIKEGEGSIVTKGQETIMLTGNIYGGSNLGQNPAIIALSGLGSGLFCAKATLESEGLCLNWLQELKEALGNKVTFHLTGKQSKENLAELRVLCQQAEIEALFAVPEKDPSLKKQPVLYSLTAGVNANGIMAEVDLEAKTGGLMFATALIEEIKKAIQTLEERIQNPKTFTNFFNSMFASKEGRVASVGLLKELQNNLEELASQHIGPIKSKSDLTFPKVLQEKIDEYVNAEVKNHRQGTETVNLLLKAIDTLFLKQTHLKTIFSEPRLQPTAAWHTSELSADNKDLDTSASESKPTPPPAALKADAKARHEAAMAAQANAMEPTDDNAEDFPPPPPLSSLDLQQPLSDFNDSDFPPPPPSPLSEEEQMPLANFDDSELPPPPPSVSSDIAQETQNPMAIAEPEVEVEAEVEAEAETEIEAGIKEEAKAEEEADIKPKAEVGTRSEMLQAIKARRAAVENLDSEESDSEPNEDELDSGSSTLFQMRQSQDQQTQNCNELQHS
ncbi:hypothetical protein [Piscirickettsia salmonis]|uniref:hypothetical protein n=1 Tax=Piscirickettsia salmonis TaxID=1238 RepID=UPI0007D7A5A5|nr:hypothetical protein A0O36_02825 [Piscirickettsiaceae bacterium NZ-RLO1]